MKENDIRVGYENGLVRFGLDDVLKLMPLEDKIKLADTLACTDDVIKFVTQQIIDRWTELGSHGGIQSPPSSAPFHGLPWAIRQIATRASEVAKREIEELARALHNSQVAHAATIEQLHRAEDQLRGYR